MLTRLAIFCGAVLFQGASESALAAELSEAKFAELHQELQPAKDTPWRSIPWKIDLLDAQKVAAKENRPIFIWAMDGHPLGCT